MSDCFTTPTPQTTSVVSRVETWLIGAALLLSVVLVLAFGRSSKGATEGFMEPYKTAWRVTPLASQASIAGRVFLCRNPSYGGHGNYVEFTDRVTGHRVVLSAPYLVEETGDTSDPVTDPNSNKKPD